MGWGIRGHEVGCGLLLAAFGAWAMKQLGPMDLGPWIAWGLLVPLAAAVRFAPEGGDPGRMRWRMATAPVVLALFYFRLGVDLPRMLPWRADGMLLGWDRQWLGETPAMLLRGWHSTWLTEWLSGCYLAYFVGYVGFLVAWVRAGGGLGWGFLRGFCWIQALGFAGYCMLPASGPGVFLAGDLAVPPWGWVGRLNDWVVRAGCNGVDVFPSLHVATTTYWIGFDVLAGRWRRACWMALPGAGLCLSTLYLRYHYAADVAAGLALGMGGLLLAWGGRGRGWAARIGEIQEPKPGE